VNAQSFPSTLELCRVRRWQGDAAAEGRAEEEDAEDKAALQVADSLRLNRHPTLPALHPLFVRCKSPSSFPPPFPTPPPSRQVDKAPEKLRGLDAVALWRSDDRYLAVEVAGRPRALPYSRGSGTGKGCERGREAL
jgi:hypothetical protein